FFLYTGALAMAFLYAVIWFFRPFSPAFGNNRGYIWGYAVGIFRRLPALQKIFGVGPDRFGVYTSRYYGARMQEIWGNTVSNAHCEYLQYLVTTGILGAMGYIAMLSAALKNSFYKKKTDPKVSLFIYGIIGYFAQALVNNHHNLLIPVFFLFLATAENEGSASSSLQI
ncbi:MAG: O-antigen ligase family protein, partial [Lachnospiraceae bacterium]|nr:O-antigen ligase family protein [Lachnospiraceae bacterium]